MTERRVGGTQAAEMLQKATETLAVGDRHLAPMDQGTG